MGTIVKTKGAMLSVALLALALAGCQSSRFGSLDSRAPAPLTPAPSGTVTASQLPPPQPAAGSMTSDAFPDAPAAPGGIAQSEEDLQLAAASAPDISPGSVAGVWEASIGGQSCKVATPQTKFGQGYRAGPLRCPPPLAGVKSWNVSGKQLSLYDDGGGILARLYSSGAERFDGQTASGEPISLSR